MDKVLAMAPKNFFMYSISRKIHVYLKTPLFFNQRDCENIIYSQRHYHSFMHSPCHELRTSQSKSLNHHRFTSPFCKFHFNSVVLKNVRLKKGLKNMANKQTSLENSEWNLQSDPGLSEILENMKTELESEEDSSNSSESVVIHEKDPDLMNLLKEIREDFQDGKYKDMSVDEAATEPASELNRQNIEILQVEDIIREPNDGMGTEDLITQSQDDMETKMEIEDFTYIEEEEVEAEWVPPIEMKRGVRGVFDIMEIVTVLQTENAKDICVIRLPEHLRLADYMVIVSGKSFRHCRAISATIQWMYKRKKKSKDPYLKVEGLNSKDWLAYDLGNIILHIFLPDVRELYDLETLWTVGEKYDNRILDIDDPFSIQQSDLEWLQELDITNLQDTKRLKKS